MEKFKLYSVSDEYIEYMRKVFPNVYSNTETTRIYTRKYVGTVICLENYHYYITMSSPKESDYQIAGEKKVIRKSIVPIMRIVVKNSKGQILCCLIPGCFWLLGEFDGSVILTAAFIIMSVLFFICDFIYSLRLEI